MNIIFILFPVMVAGHGYMAIPKARTGDDGGASNLRSPKLSPWAGYKAEIVNCGENLANGNAKRHDRGENALEITSIPAGSQFDVTYDITLGHSLSVNHMRIALRYINQATGQPTTAFLDNVLEEMEDTAAQRAANESPTFTKYLTTGQHVVGVTMPATTGRAELQWIWASERDGAGGFYISCADVEITPATGGTTQAPTEAPTPSGGMTNSPTQGGLGNFWCYETDPRTGTVSSNQCPKENDRCMTSWVNGKYYYRCAKQNYCTDVENSISNEGIDVSTGKLIDPSYAKCCDSMNCNTKAVLAGIVPGGASKLSAVVGFLIGSLLVLLL